MSFVNLYFVDFCRWQLCFFNSSHWSVHHQLQRGSNEGRVQQVGAGFVNYCPAPVTKKKSLFLKNLNFPEFDLLYSSNYASMQPHSSSPLCVEEVRLCLGAEQQVLQGKKSSSLSNINQWTKASTAGRRRSLPGTPKCGTNGKAWTAWVLKTLLQPACCQCFSVAKCLQTFANATFELESFYHCRISTDWYHTCFLDIKGNSSDYLLAALTTQSRRVAKSLVVCFNPPFLSGVFLSLFSFPSWHSLSH